MYNSLKVYAFLIGLMMGTVACTDQFIMKPHEPGVGGGCQAPAIERNIIGTWHFVATYSGNGLTREGAITFNPDLTITDPDSLFESTLDGRRVVSKIYSFKKPADVPVEVNYPAGLVYIRQIITNPTYWQIIPLTVISNKCNYIRLAVTGSNDKLYFELTR